MNFFNTVELFLYMTWSTSISYSPEWISDRRRYDLFKTIENPETLCQISVFLESDSETNLETIVFVKISNERFNSDHLFAVSALFPAMKRIQFSGLRNYIRRHKQRSLLSVNVNLLEIFHLEFTRGAFSELLLSFSDVKEISLFNFKLLDYSDGWSKLSNDKVYADSLTVKHCKFSDDDFRKFLKLLPELSVLLVDNSDVGKFFETPFFFMMKLQELSLCRVRMTAAGFVNVLLTSQALKRITIIDRHDRDCEAFLEDNLKGLQSALENKARSEAMLYLTIQVDNEFNSMMTNGDMKELKSFCAKSRCHVL